MGPPPALNTPTRPAEPLPARPRRKPGECGVASPLSRIPPTAWLGLILAIAAALRVWQLHRVGFNSDEAVYAG
jgi:hypothetical protein